MKGFFKNNSDKIFANVIVGVVLIAFYFFISQINSVMTAFSFIISVMSPFLIGFIIAYVLLPFVKKTEDGIRFLSGKAINNKLAAKFKVKVKKDNEKDSKLPRGLAVFLVYVLVAVVLAFLVNQLIPQIIESAVTFVNNIPVYLVKIKEFSESLLLKYNFNDLFIEQSKLYDAVFDYGTRFAQNLLDWVLEMPKILSNGITNSIVGIILSIYFVFDYKRFKLGGKKLVNFFFPKKASGIFYVLKEADMYVSMFFMGKVIDSLIIGLIAFPFMLIIYKPYALLISVIIGITNIIPYFGPIVGAIPGGIIILINAPEKFIWYVIFVLILQQFDGNILGPKILGDRTGLSPVGVIFGIIVGGKLFGFIGMLLGVPFTAVVCSLFKEMVDKRLVKREQKIDNAVDENEQ